MPHPLGKPPSKIIAVHTNYRSRARERGQFPDQPSYFMVPPSSLAGSGDVIRRPRGCELMGFEGEVALVVGRRAQRLSPQEAWAHVGWVTAANDAGVYDLRHADRGSNLRAKGADGFKPIGLRLLDAATLDPSGLRVRSWVNGELAQDDTTDTLIFPFATLVADLSRLLTLEPGDVILTGTPAGASVVSPGDTVEVEVSNGTLSTGRLSNPVTDAGHDLEPWGAQPKASPAERAAAWGSRWQGQPAAGTPGRVPAETLAGLCGVAVATLSAQLLKRGIAQANIDGVRPTQPGGTMVGLAHTLRYLPLREDLSKRYGQGMNAQKRAIEELQPGQVLVIDARQDRSAGTIGDILAARAAHRGAAGVVTDGGLRDSAAVAALGLPVFYAACHPAVLARRHVPWDSGIPVACGGALVQPGDVIVGDADGVVVVPPELAGDVLAASAEQEELERFIAEQVSAGSPVDGLYPPGPGWQAAYERWRQARQPGLQHHHGGQP